MSPFFAAFALLASSTPATAAAFGPGEQMTLSIDYSSRANPGEGW